MKASELRIGNCIYDNYLSANGIISGIFEDEVWVEYPNPNIKTRSLITEIKPITITEDILLKCGFSVITENEDETHNYWNKEKDCSVDVETYLLTNKIEKGFKYRVHERKRTKSIIYLHQLQNLYFCLTGTELTIKL